MDLLSRREHCYQELQQKLRKREYDHDEIDAVLQALIDDNLLNNARYTEAYVRHRGQKGYGPLRIAMELQERGIDSALIAEFVNNDSPHWNTIIEQVKQKKFADAVIEDFEDKAKQMRFLQYRGFTTQQIQFVIDDKVV